MEMIKANIASGKYTIEPTDDVKNAAICLYDDRNRVLMCVSNRGVWGLPGGIIEQGERAFTAAIRELEEETGVRFDSRLYDRSSEIKFTWNRTRFYIARYNFSDAEVIKRFVDPTGEIRHVEFPRVENLVVALKNNSVLSCGCVKAPVRSCMINCFA